MNKLKKLTLSFVCSSLPPYVVKSFKVPFYRNSYFTRKIIHFS